MQVAKCIDNKEFEEDLELGKIYPVLAVRESTYNKFVTIATYPGDKDGRVFYANRFELSEAHPISTEIDTSVANIVSNEIDNKIKELGNKIKTIEEQIETLERAKALLKME